MQRWSSWRKLPLLLIILLMSILSACGSSNAQKVTLHFILYEGGDAGVKWQNAAKAFHQQNPDITISLEIGPSDIASYQSLLQSRFSGGNSPDLIEINVGAYKTPFINAGDFVDLTNQPWVSSLTSAAKQTAVTSSTDSRVYVMPTVAGVGGVFYNKAIFSRLGLSIPTDWPTFLQDCQKIKAAGISPLATGAKDKWPLGFQLQAMTIETVYHDDPTFADKIAAGTATYANSGWVQAFQDFANLNAKGYFNPDVSGTDWPTSANIFASGKSAMLIQGDFAIPAIRQANPNIDMGMFPLPYVQPGQTPVTTSFANSTIAIGAKSAHVADAKKFLDFLANPANNSKFAGDGKDLSAFKGVVPSTIDPALQSILPALGASSGDFNSAENLTPAVSLAIQNGAQGILNGTKTPLQVTQSMDAAQHSS